MHHVIYNTASGDLVWAKDHLSSTKAWTCKANLLWFWCFERNNVALWILSTILWRENHFYTCCSFYVSVRWSSVHRCLLIMKYCSSCPFRFTAASCQTWCERLLFLNRHIKIARGKVSPQYDLSPALHHQSQKGTAEEHLLSPLMHTFTHGANIILESGKKNIRWKKEFPLLYCLCCCL